MHLSTGIWLFFNLCTVVQHHDAKNKTYTLDHSSHKYHRADAIDRSIKLRPYCVLTNHNATKVQQIRSDMRARVLGARGRVVQKGIWEAHVFLLTRASWAEPNGSVYWLQDVNYFYWPKQVKVKFTPKNDLPMFAIKKLKILAMSAHVVIFVIQKWSLSRSIWFINWCDEKSRDLQKLNRQGKHYMPLRLRRGA